MERREEQKAEARELERRGELEGALQVYRRLAEDAPAGTQGSLFSRIAALQVETGDPEAAVQSYNQAIADFKEAGYVNNAIALCRALLRIRPDDADAHRELGELALRQGYRDYARAGITAYARHAVTAGDALSAIEPVASLLDHYPDEAELLTDWRDELLENGSHQTIVQLETLREAFVQRGRPDLADRMAGEESAEAALDPALFEVLPAAEVADEETVAPDLPLLNGGPDTAPDDFGIRPIEGLEPTHVSEAWAEDQQPESHGESLPPLETTPEPGSIPDTPAPGDAEPLPLLSTNPFDEADGAALLDEEETIPRDEEELPLLDPLASVATEGEAPEGASELGDLAHRTGAVEPAPEIFSAPSEGPDVTDQINRIVDELLQISSAEVDAGDGATHYDLGVAFKEMGRTDESIGNLAMAIRRGHDAVATLEVLGEVLVDSGRGEIAERLLSQAPGAGERPSVELLGIHYWLARAGEAAGHPEVARRALQLVVSTDPDFRDASERLERLA